MAPATSQRDHEPTDELEQVSSAEKRLGTTVAGSYRLTRHIGSGGSSHVFEAEHLRLGKPFAVKLLRPELDANRRTAQRFRREARAIARLKSEHIVSVVDCGELDDGTPFLVMELLEGEDLRSLLNREGSLPARRAVPLIIEACRGLSEVHAAGLVHRDLKPENLFITKRSTGEDWCKVLDFGVAKMEASLSTAENAIVGTVRYMAPEQLADSATVGPPTDVYALGAILYECVAGRPLVSGSTLQELMYRIMNVDPAPLSSIASGLPRTLVEVVDQCLRKSPATRPSSVAELALSLEAFVAASPQRVTTNATVAEDDEQARPPSQRRSLPALLALGLLTSTLVAGFTGWYARGPSNSPLSEPPSSLSSPPKTPPVGEATITRSSIALASTPEVGAPVPSTATSHSGRPMPSTSTIPAAPGPRSVTSAASRTRSVSGFDSANPYAE
jgi:serine/threonine protein kinase